jgi:hypothetical protein
VEVHHLFQVHQQEVEVVAEEQVEVNLYQILEHLLQQEQKADHQKRLEHKLKVKNLHQKHKNISNLYE